MENPSRTLKVSLESPEEALNAPKAFSSTLSCRTLFFPSRSVKAPQWKPLPQPRWTAPVGVVTCVSYNRQEPRGPAQPVGQVRSVPSDLHFTARGHLPTGESHVCDGQSVMVFGHHCEDRLMCFNVLESPRRCGETAKHDD